MELPFIQIKDVMFNLHYLQLIVREKDELRLYFTGETKLVPRVYRGALATAIWAYLAARVPQIEESQAHEFHTLRPEVKLMPNGQPLHGSGEETTVEV